MSHVKVHSTREYMCCGPPNQEFRIAIHSSSHHGRRCKSTDWNDTCTQLTWSYDIASIQCVYPNRRRSTQGRCKCSICGRRMELYLHHLLLVHCLADHPRNRSSIQWPRTQKISAGITLPGVHGCGCVCWGLLQTPRVHRTNKALEPRFNGCSGATRWPMLGMQVHSLGPLRTLVWEVWW